MILYPTYDDCKTLNEAILKYGYWPEFNSKFKDCDFDTVDEISPIIFACGVITSIIEQIIYKPLKINETVLG